MEPSIAGRDCCGPLTLWMSGIMPSNTAEAAGGGGCRGVTRSGTPCRANPGPNGWCVFHDPGRKDQHRQISRRGGLATWERKLRVQEAETSALHAVLDCLREILHELRQPGLSASEVARLRAATYTCAIALHAVETLESLVRLDRLLELERPKARRAL